MESRRVLVVAYLGAVFGVVIAGVHVVVWSGLWIGSTTCQCDRSSVCIDVPLLLQYVKNARHSVLLTLPPVVGGLFLVRSYMKGDDGEMLRGLVLSVLSGVIGALAVVAYTYAVGMR